MEAVVFKIKFGDDIRRVKLPTNQLSYANVERVARQTFNLVPSSRVSLKYLDPEGDEVTIASDDDVSTAFASVSGTLTALVNCVGTFQCTC